MTVTTHSPVLIVLTPGGVPVSRDVQALFPQAEVHGLARRVAGVDRAFERTGEHLRELFLAGRPIIGVCAAAVLIRALAPVLDDKHAEPPVVAVAEDGSVVVPLLGGHHGAHALARRIAERLGGVAAITTAGDLRFGVALDNPPEGWTLANPDHYKAFAGALLAGASVRLEGEAAWLRDSRLPFAADARHVIRITDRVMAGGENTLVYHPRDLAVGVGAERGANADEVIALVRETLAANGLAEDAVAGLFSLDVKADEPAVHAAAVALGVPVRFFDAATLERETPRLATPSEVVFRQVGCHGVAEAAALAATGPGGDLIVAKAKTAGATCAVGRATGPLDAARIGRKRGRLAVIGLGPGALDWRTPEASAWLAEAEDVVGYTFYNDLVGTLPSSAVRHDFPLGQEELRARKALDLAAGGRTVALVSSGDPGIYAMATLVFELLDKAPTPEWQRVEITVVPGLSAFQAAAARIGAPMAHDLCLISLSDLLTPWDVILKRVEAAAIADFLIAFYNPVSRKRRTQLAESVAVLLRHRPADTPVVVARQLGRADEDVRVIHLDELTPDHADMLTLLLIGSSETRVVARADGGQWVYTPRGYAGKVGSALRETEA
jgi:cobalt-precorrin 5A hydrolase/precorrin-3B C17-methyltransferase